MRWNELLPYVTKFVILESNSTFTGLPKPLVFESNKEMFQFAESKYLYGTVGDVDEIPSAHTISFLRSCEGIPPIMYLQLHDYLYSFKYFQGYGSGRSSVHIYQKGKT